MGARQSADEQLIERARDGDRASRQELWRTHRRWVAAIILAHRPHALELEDLLQDVALRFIDKIHTLRESAAFRPWLRQIAVNVCRGAARSFRPALPIGTADGSETEGHGAVEPAEPGNAQRDYERGDAAGRLLRQALSLPMAYREPLLLRCLRSLSYQQIGQILDLPVTTVETRLCRARRMLREELPDMESALEEHAPSTSRARRI
jgi:RNA polymerase sigma-70 factor (ECF subfamily)